MDDEYYDYSDMVSCDISEDDTGMHPALLQAGYMQDKKTPKPKPRKRRCGECDACKRDDCGQCKPCSALPRFGGSSQKKQACANRKCLNMPLSLQDFDPAANLAKLQEKPKKNEYEYQKMEEKFTDGNWSKHICQKFYNIRLKI